MDMSTLIDELVARVSAKVAEVERGEGAPCTCSGEKPGLLILTADHGDTCHAMLESPKLCARYRTDCALRSDYHVELADFDAVILFGLTNEVLGKLASGVCDTPQTRLAAQALLMGKKLFVPTEEVELYRYASTAPAPYYGMMQQKLDLLTASGMVICSQSNLEDVILGGTPAAPCACSAVPQAARPACEVRVNKRVLTERDISDARAGEATIIHVGPKTIITDLAKDCARARDIQILRD
ncbi:MAG: hypothetical protein RRY65_00145 [Pseudoflavonifractor sp.]